MRRKVPEEIEDGKKRGVTSAIEKNRGITRSRPKDKKTPKTKLRSKYESKTKNLRKIRENSSIYGGERSIKTNVTTSRKL